MKIVGKSFKELALRELRRPELFKARGAFKTGPNCYCFYGVLGELSVKLGMVDRRTGHPFLSQSTLV